MKMCKIPGGMRGAFRQFQDETTAERTGLFLPKCSLFPTIMVEPLRKMHRRMADGLSLNFLWLILDIVQGGLDLDLFPNTSG